MFAAVLADAQSAVSDPVPYGLDAEGATALAARLTRSGRRPHAEGRQPRRAQPRRRDDHLERPHAAGEADLAGAEAKVTWSLGSVAGAKTAAELGTFAATGRSTEKLSSGLYQRFSATVLVVPADLEYFIDSGASGAPAGSVYSAVKAAVPDLLNDTSDQKWDGTAAGETWGYSTTATTLAAGTPQDWGSSYVGADFNKPITYHLTLPAGSYSIVGVQAPRAGLTTNVYSKVKVAGTETTKSAVSTGSATPVAQTVTFDADAVVDLEFGTTGTSGYNARLALVYVQSLPRDLGVQGALGVDDDLPETVDVAGTPRTVEWDAASAAQPRAEFATLTVTGRLTDTDQAVVARFEIVPPALVYYIDSGTSGVASPQYAAVAKAVALRNDKVDQVSAAADQWGYVADGMKVKGTTDINDKYSTGLYQDTTRLVYRLPLDAGTYTLTGGFTEWWGLNRTMYQTVSVAGTELAKGSVPLSGTNTPLAAPLTFTLTASATVDYVVTNEGAGGEKPVISWLAVADQTLPGAPQNATATLRGRHVHHGLVGCRGPHRPGIHRVSRLRGRRHRPGVRDEQHHLHREGARARHDARVRGGGRQRARRGRALGGHGIRHPARGRLRTTARRRLPARRVLSSNDGWDTGLKDGTFQVAMNLWWGENGSLFKLYRDGELVAKVPLTMMTPGAQRAVVDITGLANGTYVFTGELVNSKGTTATQSLTVKVTDAAPGKPVLSADNNDGDGTYTVTADLWWGTNATSYRFLENGVAVGSGSLSAASPAEQHAKLTVSGKPKGSYAYVVEFTNDAGTTTSKALTVKVNK